MMLLYSDHLWWWIKILVHPFCSNWSFLSSFIPLFINFVLSLLSLFINFHQYILWLFCSFVHSEFSCTLFFLSLAPCIPPFFLFPFPAFFTRSFRYLSLFLCVLLFFKLLIHAFREEIHEHYFWNLVLFFALGIYTKYKQLLTKDKLIFRRLSKVRIF